MKKNLYIIDTMAMAFRSYHAFGARPLTTASGQPTSALYGSLSFILSLIEKEKPDYLLFATDTKEKTFRHTLYPEYKANRDEMPEDLAAQIQPLYELIEILGCPLLKMPGFEADDLIGSLVTQYRSDDLHHFIVSGDKDFMQLINERVSLYAPKKAQEALIINKDQVFEKFGCAPIHVIDALAIIGDSSDNVPGVRGIGEKGAAKLVCEFGSLENIYANLAKIGNQRQIEALKTGQEQVYLSRELVTIKTDIPLNFDLESSTFSAAILGNGQLEEFCERMEFKSIVSRVNRIAGSASGESKLVLTKTKAANSSDEKPVEEKTAPSKKKKKTSLFDDIDADQGVEVKKVERVFNPNYKQVNTAAIWREVVDKWQKSSVAAFDTETTGLNIVSDVPIGLSLSFEKGHAYYLPLADEHFPSELNRKEFMTQLKKMFASPDIRKVAHNLKFDLQMLKNIDIDVAGPYGDTMIAAYLVESAMPSYGLDSLCLNVLEFKKIPISELINVKKDESMLSVPLDLLTEYACEDADYTLRLYDCYFPQLEEKKLWHLFETIEIPLVPVLANMEQAGIYVDKKTLASLSRLLDKKIAEAEEKIYKEAGEEFNINSTKQLQYIMYEKLKVHEKVGITRLKKTKSGFSTDVSMMEKLSDHPLPQVILDYRTLAKLKNTYVDTLPELIDPKSGRIHTHFNQTGTTTGRLSSNNPNLQNIPIRSTLGKEIRKAFRAPSSDCVILSADYSQMELRVMAHVAKEKSLVAAFLAGEDIHRSTAAKVFGVSIDDVDDNMRANAKAINFGIMYGMGPQRLARETGVSMNEAKLFIEKYFEGFPAIRKFISGAIEDAKRKGYTETITGRRRSLPDIKSDNRMLQVAAENMAINTPIQGSSADIIKKAMVDLSLELQAKKAKSRILLQVHDELVLEVPQDEIAMASEMVKRVMESAVTLDVPLLTEIGYGENWLEAH